MGGLCRGSETDWWWVCVGGEAVFLSAHLLCGGSAGSGACLAGPRRTRAQGPAGGERAAGV